MKPAEVLLYLDADLHDRIQVEKNRLDTLRLNHSVSPVENTSEFKKIRKDIARMITILAEKEKAQKN